MTVYECEACGFKTDEFSFMKVHRDLSDHQKLVDENNEWIKILQVRMWPRVLQRTRNTKWN